MGQSSRAGKPVPGRFVDSKTAGTGEFINDETGAVTQPGEPLPPIEQPGEPLPPMDQEAGDELPPAIAYEAGEHLVYVRTATSGQHGIPVHPHNDVPADARPAHVVTLENLGLITRKP